MANDIKVIVQAILDDKNFKKGIKGIKGGFDDASKKAKKHGSVMGKLKGAYLAIAAVMTGAVIAGMSKVVKAGIDAQETFSKFRTVFKDVAGQAQDMASSFADSFGLSSVKAQQLLGDTGDLLSGFGFTGQAALDMSGAVNELAVDLASFTNFAGGAEGASAALTRGLLGEREAMKGLGIAIGELDIKQRALVEGMDPKNLTRQQKAILTLKLAVDQSKNAVGDFARTQMQAANQIRILRSRFENIIVTLGTKFIPILEKALPILNEWMSSIDKALKDVPKTIQEFREKSDKALSGFLDAPIASLGDFVKANQKTLEKIGANVGIFLLKILNMALKFTGKFANLFAFAFNGIVTGINKIAGTSIPTLGEAFVKMTESLDFSILEMETALDRLSDKTAETNEAIVESEKEKNDAIVEDAIFTGEEIAEINKELQEVNKSIREEDLQEELDHLQSLLDLLTAHGKHVIREEEKLRDQIAMIQDAIVRKQVEVFQKRAKLLKDFSDTFESIGNSMLEYEKRRLKGMKENRDKFSEKEIQNQKNKMRSIAKFNRNVASFSAAVDAAAAVVKTMASVPYPVNIPLAAAQAAAGALKVGLIRSEPLPSFAKGTEALDRDSIIQAHEGERIVPADMNIRGMSNVALMRSAIQGLAVQRSGDVGAVDNSVSNANTQNNNNVINVPDGVGGIEEVLEFAQRTNAQMFPR